MRKSVVGTLILTATVILAFSLGTSRLPGRTDAQPPELQSSPLSLDTYESSLLVPVSITAPRLAEILDDLIPRSFSGRPPINIGGNVHRERLDYTVNRGSIVVRANRDRIQITTPLSGRATARADLCPFGRRLGCSSIRESADVSATASVTLANIRLDPDWTVQADPPDVNVTVTRAEVRLLGDLIPISFRGALQEEIDSSLPSLTRDFSNLLEDIDLVTTLEGPWRSMHRTIQVSRDPEVWLAIEPRSVGASSLTASDDLVTALLALSATMAINFGDQPTIAQQSLRREPIQEDAAPAFRLRVPVVAELDELASELNACCSPVSVSLAGDESVTFSNLTLTEHQGGLLLGADFAMSGWWTPRGTVYVMGTPALQENTLKLNDLQFTVESSSVLTTVAAEVARPVVLDHLHNELRIDMTEYYTEATTVLESAIAELDVGSDVDIRIEVGDVELVDVSAGDAMIAVVGEVTGAATIEVVTP